MKFIISRNRLLQALQHTRCGIRKGDQNVFKCYVFTFSDDPADGLMTVHTSDGETWISETVLLDAPATVPDGSPSGLRPFAVWHSDLLRAIKALDDQPLEFTVGEYQLTVRHSCGSFRLPLSGTAEEFLQMPRPCPDIEAPDGYLLEYEAPGLRSILARCAFAMAQDELRPAMNGVYVNLTANYSDYVSSDGHKLVCVRKRPVMGSVVYGRPGCSFILPAHVVRTLLKVLPPIGDVVVEYQHPFARIITDDTLTISFRLVNGRYPSYRTVIPDSFSFHMDIDRRPLVKSLGRLALFQPPGGLVELHVTDGVLRLYAKDTDFQLDADETLSCECSLPATVPGGFPPGNKSIRIGMKAASLLQTLKVLSTERVQFRFIDPSRAVVIHPVPQPDVEHVTMLLMPMILGD